MRRMTITMPEDLHRQVKAKAALDGISIQEITNKLYEAWLTDKVLFNTNTKQDFETWLRKDKELIAEIAKLSTDKRLAREILNEGRK